MSARGQKVQQARPNKNQLLAMYETMLLIRRVEETLMEVFSAGEIPGFLHVCLGQEAVPAAVAAHLSQDDYIGTTHRGHGHALAKGVDLNLFMAEIYGRANGYCLGRSGSMHLADAGHGVLGANGIVGGGIPITTGAAFACAYKHPGRVAVCFFGEGASSQGAFYESLNMAALWKLPVVYVCENNGWAEFTPQSVHMTVADVAQRARAAGVEAEVVSNDVLAIHQVAGRAIARARSGEGPFLLEVKCNRWHGHFVGDAQKYRGKDAVAQAMSDDCLARFEQELIGAKVLTAKKAKELDQEKREAVAQAVEFARSSPMPQPGDLAEGLYL
ncbi:MAG: thiamine pyrophosphate-dependent dehydrogenase E1 component subunit alpha [Proteobacteria bacterium]|nr:thiamine pyrophosphate-dependent dehydrogenase E1 component subunit alpha [Pseudomonadota bacterium]